MPGMPEEINTYERRFGNIAIEKGFIVSYDLAEALKIQVQEEIEIDDRRLIGQILFELNRITVDQIKEVLGELIGE
jgi:hypothetical protein